MMNLKVLYIIYSYYPTYCLMRDIIWLIKNIYQYKCFMPFSYYEEDNFIIINK